MDDRDKKPKQEFNGLKIASLYLSTLDFLLFCEKCLMASGLRNRALGLGPGCTRHKFAAQGLTPSGEGRGPGQVAFSDLISRHCLCHLVNLGDACLGVTQTY